MIIYLSARLTEGAKQNIEKQKGPERTLRRRAKRPKITSGKHVDNTLGYLITCSSAAGEEPAEPWRKTAGKAGAKAAAGMPETARKNGVDKRRCVC